MSAELGSRRALRLPTQLALLDGNLYIAATGSNQVGTFRLQKDPLFESRIIRGDRKERKSVAVGGVPCFLPLPDQCMLPSYPGC
jgi:hypothetical protein